MSQKGLTTNYGIDFAECQNIKSHTQRETGYMCSFLQHLVNTFNSCALCRNLLRVNNLQQDHDFIAFVN